MTDRDILDVLVVVVCAALSFLFSGMETGVLALNRFRIRQLKRAGDRRAAALHVFLEHPENFLWTILVGNTVVNFVIFSLVSLQLYYWLGGKPVLWAVGLAPGVFVFYILCELAPKTLFQRYPNRLSLGLARPFRLIHRVLAPLVAVVDWFSRGLLHLTGGRAFTGRLFGSREELRFIMQESAAGLTSEEKTMINRVLDLPNLRVRHVMVPRIKTETVDASVLIGQVLDLCSTRSLTRMPVVDAAAKRIIGVIDLEQVIYEERLDPSKPARAYAQAPFFLPEELHLEEALRRMQRTGERLAVVLGSDQRETGIITLQDILKVIFGEVIL
jgi:CBS domain containing-hemolysin-like protein